MSEFDKLLERMKWDHPGLSSAKREYDARHRDACVAEIIRHFTARTSPAYLFEYDDIKKCRDAEIVKEADEVLGHYIYGHQFDGEIDWMMNPTEHTSHDNEWSWSLFRNIYWQQLARGYVATGDEKYAAEFVKQMKSFAAAWPVDDFLNDTTFETKFKFPGHAWRTIETAMRMYTTWIPCYFAFRASSSWDADGWAVFLNMVTDHAEYLMTHYSNHERSSNWLTMESSALLQCGILFPELKGSESWFETGYRRVMHEIKYSFDNDGVHMERTPIYHMVAANAYLQAWKLCDINGIPVPPYALPTLVKAAEFIMLLVKPDFSTPMIGDADRNDLLARRSDTSVYEGMNLTFNPADLNEMRAYFQTMHGITGSPEFLYFATGRREGSAPKARNYALREAGVYVMRTGWKSDDSYFLLHGVQLERGEKSTHSHNDQGHLELHIRGEDVLIDCGRYIYNSSCWKEWRHYFTSACAHNTLYVDDHEMGTVPNVSRVRGVRTFCHRFEETADYGIIDISHNGYAFMDDPVFHRRRVIRLEGDVYVIDDQITGLGKTGHDIRLYFNFAPGDLERARGNDYRYVSGRGTKFGFFSVLNDGIVSSVLKGSEDPIGGWVSYGYPVREPTPQLCLSAKGPAPVRFLTVIAPDGVGCRGTVSGDTALLEFQGGRIASVGLSGENIAVRKGE